MNWKKYLPILEWLPNYPKQQLPADILAGITIGVMVIPQGMAYGMLAGLPPIYGLYATLVPLFIYVLFGTSRQLVVGPTAMLCLLISSSIGGLAMRESAEYIGLVVMLSFVVGCLQLLFGVFRLGFFTNFLSHPILNGFISAASIIIIGSQLKNLFGIETEGAAHNLIEIGSNLGQYLSYWDPITFAIGLSAILFILVIKKINKAIPAPLLVLAISIGLMAYYEEQLPSVLIVGYIPKGLPSVSVPTFSLENISLLAPGILTITLIGILESISIAKVMQARHKDYELIPNQELRALGIANIIGSFFQAFPAAGSFSRTAVNDEFGAKSGISSLVAAIVVGITLLFLTPLFYYLPKTILAAIIIVAVLRLIDFKEVVFLWKSDRLDCFMLLLTFFATLFIGIEQGILLGVFVSLLMVLYKTTRPHITILGKIPETPHYKNIEIVEDLIIRKDILIIRPDAPLFFANIGYFKERMEQEVAQKEAALKLIIFNADCLPHLDSSATHVLRELIAQYKAAGIMVYFTGISEEVYTILKKSGVLALLGGSYLFEKEQDAVGYFDKQVAKSMLKRRNVS